MKRKVIKFLLIVLIVIHAAAPFWEFAVNGYEDLMAMLADVYDNGIIVLLSAAILNLYNSETRGDD